jgi:hypothetical protein
MTGAVSRQASKLNRRLRGHQPKAQTGQDLPFHLGSHPNPVPHARPTAAAQSQSTMPAWARKTHSRGGRASDSRRASALPAYRDTCHRRRARPRARGSRRCSGPRPPLGGETRRRAARSEWPAGAARGGSKPSDAASRAEQAALASVGELETCGLGKRYMVGSWMGRRRGWRSPQRRRARSAAGRAAQSVSPVASSASTTPSHAPQLMASPRRRAPHPA